MRHTDPASPATPKGFTRLLAAAAVSNLGDGVRLAALPLLAVQLTDDARLVGAVTSLAFLPWVLVGPVSGAVVDRADRRVVIVLGQAVRAVAVLALAVAVSGGWATIWLVLAVAFVVGVGETLVDSATQAAVPQLVPARLLERANGRIVVAQTLFDEVVGVALGGLLFAQAAALPFWVDAASFAVAAFLVVGIATPLRAVRDDPDQQGLALDVVEGGRFLLHQPLLRRMAISVGVTNVGRFMGMAVLVILVVDELGGRDATYGLVLAAGAVGGVLGSATGGWTAERLTPTVMLRLVHVPYVLGLGLLAAAHSPAVAAVGVACLAYGVVSFKVPSQSLRQRVTPDHLLGRTVAAFRVVGLGGPVLGAALGGVVAQTWGVRTAFALGAGVLVVGWLLLLAALRSAPDHNPDGRVPVRAGT